MELTKNVRGEFVGGVSNMTALDYADWVATFTLLFAVCTYWNDYYRKWLFITVLKQRLNTELRTIYIANNEDILKYGSIKADYQARLKENGARYLNEKLLRNFHDPYLLFSRIVYDNYDKLFSNDDSIASISEIKSLLTLIERECTPQSTLNIKFLEGHFDRFIRLRDALLCLEQFTAWVDLSPMPKESFSRPYNELMLNQWRQQQEMNKRTEEIIKVNRPGEIHWESNKVYLGGEL
jgi:hypothetical protein